MLAQHFDTDAESLPICTANHLFVLPCSVRMTLTLFIILFIFVCVNSANIHKKIVFQYYFKVELE